MKNKFLSPFVSLLLSAIFLFIGASVSNAKSKELTYTPIEGATSTIEKIGGPRSEDVPIYECEDNNLLFFGPSPKYLSYWNTSLTLLVTDTALKSDTITHLPPSINFISPTLATNDNGFKEFSWSVDGVQWSCTILKGEELIVYDGYTEGIFGPIKGNEQAYSHKVNLIFHFRGTGGDNGNGTGTLVMQVSSKNSNGDDNNESLTGPTKYTMTFNLVIPDLLKDHFSTTSRIGTDKPF